MLVLHSICSEWNTLGWISSHWSCHEHAPGDNLAQNQMEKMTWNMSHTLCFVFCLCIRFIPHLINMAKRLCVELLLSAFVSLLRKPVSICCRWSQRRHHQHSGPAHHREERCVRVYVTFNGTPVQRSFTESHSAVLISVFVIENAAALEELLLDYETKQMALSKSSSIK